MSIYLERNKSKTDTNDFKGLVILIPFIIVNGILTGSFIEGEIVWYNPDEITGIRLITIPVEDFAYGFSLILINLHLMNYFRKLFIKKQDS